MEKIKKDKLLSVDCSALLLGFLFSSLPDMKKKDVKALLSHGSVLVNGRQTTKFNLPLCPGDNITIDFSGSAGLLEDYKLRVIYEDAGLIAVDKPHGLLSVPDEKGEKNEKINAFDIMSEYVKRRAAGSRLFVLHRLDRDTSGVLIFAKSDKLRKKFQDDWNNLVSERIYIAVCEGAPEPSAGRVTAYLKQDKNNMVYSAPDKRGQLAITEYSVMKSNDKYSLVRLCLHSGRKNQIRVCMRDLGAPVSGDRKYGGKQSPLHRMCLHCERISLENPETGERLSFVAKAPKKFGFMFT